MATGYAFSKCAMIIKRPNIIGSTLLTKSLILNLPRTYGAYSPFISWEILRKGKRCICSTCIRRFSSLPRMLKKKERRDEEAGKETHAPTTKLSSDPWEFSSLNHAIKDLLLKLQSEMAKLRTGGKFNPELLDNLRVQIQKGSKSTERLKYLAQVTPKGGRSLIIHVGDKAHVKPIISAIQSSPTLNLQPIQNPIDATQLTIPIPPPTRDSRDLALKSASKAGEAAIIGIRLARGVIQKKLRNIEIKKLANPDDIRKAHKEMEKIVEKGIVDARKIVEDAHKSMEQS